MYNQSTIPDVKLYLYHNLCFLKVNQKTITLVLPLPSRLLLNGIQSRVAVECFSGSVYHNDGGGEMRYRKATFVNLRQHSHRCDATRMHQRALHVIISSVRPLVDCRLPVLAEA